MSKYGPKLHKKCENADVKDLGIVTDKELKFNKHIFKIYSEVGNYLFYLECQNF